MLICLDSQIIIWGIKEQASSGQEDMLVKAADFFNWIDENNHDVIIPAIVLAEILAPEPEEIRGSYIEIINKTFIIAPFDSKCALKYAEVMHERFKQVKSIAKGLTEDEKKRVKADHLIIATAMANNANCIYSYDKGLKAFANRFIDVREFPKMTKQGKLGF